MLISPFVNTLVTNATRRTSWIPIVATLVLASLSQNILIINKMTMTVAPLSFIFSFHFSKNKIYMSLFYNLYTERLAFFHGDCIWMFHLFLSNSHVTSHRAPYRLFLGCFEQKCTSTHRARTRPMWRRTNFASPYVTRRVLMHAL